MWHKWECDRFVLMYFLILSACTDRTEGCTICDDNGHCTSCGSDRYRKLIDTGTMTCVSNCDDGYYIEEDAPDGLCSGKCNSVFKCGSFSSPPPKKKLDFFWKAREKW